MPSTVPPSPSRRPGLLVPLFLLVLGAVTLVIAWSLLGLSTGRQHGWLALAAGVQAGLMLRLGGMRRGLPRMLLAVLATLAVVAAAQWAIAAGHIGAQMGLMPWESLLKMGPGYAWTLSALANTGTDLACLALAPLAALLAAR